jgi:hypothetical protein
MEIKDVQYLCTDSDGTRYFLIPVTQELPSGNFIIYTIGGEKNKVDSAKLADFEISEEEAKTHLYAEMSQAMDQAKSTITSLLTFATQVGLQKAPSQSSTSSVQTQEGLKIISSLLGISPEVLKSDPKAAQESLSKLLDSLKVTIETATAQDSEQLEKLREQMHTVQQRLQKQGIKVDADLEELSNQLREWYLSTNSEQNLEEMSDNLRKFADQLDQLLAEAKENDDQLSLAFLKGLRGFLSTPEDDIHEQEKRQQKYRKDARESIERARQGRKIPSFSFDNLLSKSNQTKSSNRS